MRKEILKDKMIFNCFKALQNDATDFAGFEEKLTAIILEEVTTFFEMVNGTHLGVKANYDESEVDSSGYVNFYKDGKIVLAVEVVA